MSSFFSRQQIDKIISFALEAGEVAAHAFRSKDFETSRKADNSKVTSIDIRISELLREKLEAEFPQIPVICEEGKLRDISGDTFFLIDPIDGTSSFASGNVEFAINIALVKNKKAIFGLIYAPVFEGGKMVFSNCKNQVVVFDSSQNQKILEAVKPDSSSLRIITSSRTKDDDVVAFVSQKHPEFINNYSVEKLASAVKFFRLLEGDSNLYLHFRNSMEWDTAAGQALVELMNGKVKNLIFNPDESVINGDLQYQKPNFENRAFVAFF